MSDPTNPDHPYGQTPPPPPPPPGYPSYPATPPPPYGANPYAAGAPGLGGPPGHVPAYDGPAVPYAHWGLRLGGYLLDSLLLLPFYLVAGVAAGLSEDPDTGQTNGGALAVTIVAYLAVFGFAIWNQVIRQGRTGQSLGKQWVGIRLVREDNGQPLGGGLTLGRALLHILDALPCYLGFLWPLWDPKRQTFADKIVSSVVLRAGTYAPVPPTWPQPPQQY
jgi:uncharacterized RDD family membrane protein YckC